MTTPVHERSSSDAETVASSEQMEEYKTITSGLLGKRLRTGIKGKEPTMKIDTLNAINERAKSQNDGVWQIKGHLVKVKNGFVTHYLDSDRRIMEYFGHFSTAISGTIKLEDDARKEMNALK